MEADEFLRQYFDIAFVAAFLLFMAVYFLQKRLNLKKRLERFRAFVITTYSFNLASYYILALMTGYYFWLFLFVLALFIVSCTFIFNV